MITGINQKPKQRKKRKVNAFSGAPVRQAGRQAGISLTHLDIRIPFGICECYDCLTID